MRIKKKYLVLSVLLILIIVFSYIKYNQPSVFRYYISKQNTYLTISKQVNAKFDISFSKKGNDKILGDDYLRFRTRAYINLAINDSDTIYLEKTINLLAYNLKDYTLVIVDSNGFSDMFYNGSQLKSGYSYISIDTREYFVYINDEMVREGDILGGW